MESSLDELTRAAKSREGWRRLSKLAALRSPDDLVNGRVGEDWISDMTKEKMNERVIEVGKEWMRSLQSTELARKYAVEKEANQFLRRLEVWRGGESLSVCGERKTEEHVLLDCVRYEHLREEWRERWRVEKGDQDMMEGFWYKRQTNGGIVLYKRTQILRLDPDLTSSIPALGKCKGFKTAPSSPVHHPGFDGVTLHNNVSSKVNFASDIKTNTKVLLVVLSLSGILNQTWGAILPNIQGSPPVLLGGSQFGAGRRAPPDWLIIPMAFPVVNPIKSAAAEKDLHTPNAPKVEVNPFDLNGDGVSDKENPRLPFNENSNDDGNRGNIASEDSASKQRKEYPVMGKNSSTEQLTEDLIALNESANSNVEPFNTSQILNSTLDDTEDELTQENPEVEANPFDLNGDIAKSIYLSDLPFNEKPHGEKEESVSTEQVDPCRKNPCPKTTVQCLPTNALKLGRSCYVKNWKYVHH
ncbi:hypothetical protein CAPTEDRAFT_207643 [Capitella teleta]|uniref:Uncharacterized protein n=1 Tax=Capitella teleta TaxID=283909 RepID=R7TKY7_CAPTE|nr:hypothetical protein CAPTEDRAFT_207643 [Capitella teleta]|eukprot:ELT94498.1 hypothetical protein CAPTEDRAFT_207643 [Capitella teleta]